MFIIFFIIVFVLTIYGIGSGIIEFTRNNNSALEEKLVKISSKREERRYSGHIMTNYYISFEFEDGIRKEFSLSGGEYGLLAEGDIGILKYQGTRYLGFNRK